MLYLRDFVTYLIPNWKPLRCSSLIEITNSFEIECENMIVGSKVTKKGKKKKFCRDKHDWG